MTVNSPDERYGQSWLEDSLLPVERMGSMHRTRPEAHYRRGLLRPDHPLLTPIQLGALYAPNRILMASMTRTRADDHGVPAQFMADYYAQRANSGLVITEGTFPAARGHAYPRQPGLHTDAQQAGWARVAEAVHAAVGRIVVQLVHSGRISHPDILHGQLPARTASRSTPSTDTC